MPFTIRPDRRFSVQCPVSHSSGPFHRVGKVWNFSLTGRHLYLRGYGEMVER